MEIFATAGNFIIALRSYRDVQPIVAGYRKPMLFFDNDYVTLVNLLSEISHRRAYTLIHTCAHSHNVHPSFDALIMNSLHYAVACRLNYRIAWRVA